jgi:hypothetical protein
MLQLRSYQTGLQMLRTDWTIYCRIWLEDNLNTQKDPRSMLCHPLEANGKIVEALRSSLRS